MMTVFIEPSDVLIFRDARPFAPGERSLSTGTFPPSGRTLSGALRAASIVQTGGLLEDPTSWAQGLGTPDSTGSMRLTGPFLARKADAGWEPLYPMPADVVRQSSGWSFMRPTRSTLAANWPKKDLHSLAPVEAGKPEKFDPGWMDAATFSDYLNGVVPTAFVSPESLFCTERRTSVHLVAGAKTAVEGNLYEVAYVRMSEGTGLLAHVEGIPLRVPCSIALGGERRSAVVTEARVQEPQARVCGSGDGWTRLRLYLATPGRFDYGWLPSCLEKGELAGIRLRLVAAAINRAMPIHGFDIHRGIARPTVQAVPAGSVYFIEAQCSADDAIAALHGCSIADTESEIGFGLVYTGGWEYV